MPRHVTADGQNKATLYLTKICYIKRGLNYLCSKITKLMFAALALRLSEELTEKRSFYGRKLTLNKSFDTKFSPSTQHHSFFTDQDLHKFYLIPSENNAPVKLQFSLKKIKPKHLEKSSQIRVENRHITLSPFVQHLCHHCPNDNCDIHIVLIVLIATQQPCFYYWLRNSATQLG